MDPGKPAAPLCEVWKLFTPRRETDLETSILARLDGHLTGLSTIVRCGDMLLSFELIDLIQEFTGHGCQQGSNKGMETGISRDRHQENTQCGDKRDPSRPAKNMTYPLMEEDVACPGQFKDSLLYVG